MSNKTLGGMIDGNFDIFVNCTGCDRSKRLDLYAMADKYGRDHGALHDDLIRMPWRCHGCGSRSVTFTVMPGSKEYAAARAAKSKKSS